MLKMQQAEEKIRTGYGEIKEISLTDQENSHFCSAGGERRI